MRSTSSRIWSALCHLPALWLWLVLLTFSSAITFAYDCGPKQTYDGTIKPIFRYDVAGVLATGKSDEGMTRYRISFARFAEFLAADKGLSGTSLARHLGRAGEDAVGITGPKTAIEIPGSGQIRIPDALTDATLTEVKNVGSLSYTTQLLDFTTYSQANGLNFELWVRPSTQL